MDLISREKLKEVIEPMVGMFDEEGDFWWSRESILRAIDNAPTIEERKEGEWVDNKWLGEKCSVCGWDLHYINFGQFKYCPNCGARMKGEANDRP